MVGEVPVSAEYRAARRVLLDALEALAPHRHALVLVGAQAVYFHAPIGDSRPSYTTDGDLAIDPEILSEEPDLAAALEAAGFVLGEHGNPGHWVSPDGVGIDLMVPSGSPPVGTSRGAPLDGHRRTTARRTPGLELALHDNAPAVLAALDPDDMRHVTVRIAGPSALLIAKLVKIQERINGNQQDRVLPKDAGDVLRLLRNVDAREVGERLRQLATSDAHSARLIDESLAWLADDLNSRAPALIDLAVRELATVETRPQVAQSLRILAGRTLESYRGGA